MGYKSQVSFGFRLGLSWGKLIGVQVKFKSGFGFGFQKSILLGRVTEFFGTQTQTLTRPKLHLPNLCQTQSEPDCNPNFATQLHHYKGPEIIYDELPNGQKRYFKDLMSHKDSISNDPERLDYFHKTFECLQVLWDGTGEILDKSEILELYGKIYINSMEMNTDDYHNIGKAIYLHFIIMCIYFSVQQ